MLDTLIEVFDWLIRLWTKLSPETKEEIKEKATDAMDVVFRQYYEWANAKARGS